jgi:hypothetical protein
LMIEILILGNGASSSFSTRGAARRNLLPAAQ